MAQIELEWDRGIGVPVDATDIYPPSWERTTVYETDRYYDHSVQYVDTPHETRSLTFSLSPRIVRIAVAFGIGAFLSLADARSTSTTDALSEGEKGTLTVLSAVPESKNNRELVLLPHVDYEMKNGALVRFSFHHAPYEDSSEWYKDTYETYEALHDIFYPRQGPVSYQILVTNEPTAIDFRLVRAGPQGNFQWIGAIQHEQGEFNPSRTLIEAMFHATHTYMSSNTIHTPFQKRMHEYDRLRTSLELGNTYDQYCVKEAHTCLRESRYQQLKNIYQFSAQSADLTPR